MSSADDETEAFKAWYGDSPTWSGKVPIRFEAWRAWSAAVARVTLRDVSTDEMRAELGRRQAIEAAATDVARKAWREKYNCPCVAALFGIGRNSLPDEHGNVGGLFIGQGHTADPFCTVCGGTGIKP